MGKKAQRITTIIVLLVLLPLAAYLGFQIVAVLDRPYVTETAIRYDMSDSLLLEGYVSFDQQEVAGEGMMGYLVENGQRVSAGTQVAEQYTDPSQANARREITELDAQLELLKKSENTTATDVGVLLNERQSSFYDFLDSLDEQDYQATEKTASR